MESVNIDKPAHSPIGASSCERWWNCPGSVKLLSGLPQNTDTIYSATGTVAHSLAEKTLRNLIAFTKGETVSLPDLEDEIGRSYVEGGFEIEVNETMTSAVAQYVQVILNYLNHYLLDAYKDLTVEVGFSLPHLDAEAYGTCDASIVVPMNRLIVIDYKHGQGHAVDVIDNKQLLYYALGAYYDLSIEDRKELAWVEMVVVQPRAKHLDGVVRSQVLTIAELLKHETELRDAIKRVRSGDDTLAVGTWCKFCAAKPVCPETRNHIQRLAEVSFTTVETQKINLPQPATLSVERLSNLMRNASEINAWCSSILSLGHRLAEAGQEIPGYKLVEKKGNRRWINEEDIERAYALEFEDKLYNRKIKSPAQLEKLLGKRRTELESFIEVPVTGKTLVPVEDLRAEAVPDSVTAFEVYVPE